MRVLVVEDEEALRRIIERRVRAWDYAVETAADAEAGLARLATGRFDLVLTDVRMPGMQGDEFLHQVKAQYPSIEVVLVTAHASIKDAVAAIRDGARDYLTKPIDFLEMEVILAQVDAMRRLRGENAHLRALARERMDADAPPLVSRSAAMGPLFEAVAALQRNRSTVLVAGESGTGKEVVARAIHYGSRAKGLFLALNCGSVSRTLLASQLFGHVKGAFTGAISDAPGYFRSASGGTLFLDEITEMNLDVQAHLLRALQAHEVTPVGGTKPIPVDARIIAATNRSPKEAVETGRLREDLYYRLNVVRIEVPALRDRREDVPLLGAFFSEKFARQYGVEPKRVREDALGLLLAYGWPGNVRELENVVERAFALEEGGEITPASLPPEIAAPARAPGAPGAPGASAAVAPCAELPPRLSEAEEIVVRRALDAAGGNRSGAARLLGVSRNRLYRLIERHGL